MRSGGITTMEVRKINHHNIYSYIYGERCASKQGIAEDLGLSLSTVTQSLKVLEADSVIRRDGYFQSTGGRKAQRIEIVKDAQVAVGINVLKDTVHLVAMNLYGEVIKKERHSLDFDTQEAYYSRLGELAADFISGESWKDDRLLGAGIAIQGIISSDGQTVKYGPILGNTGLTLAKIGRDIPCRSLLFHDSRAAAWAEIWTRPSLRNAVVLLLNQNLGAALIIDRKIYYGEHMYGGLIEHISLDENGPLCYCGSRGCLETLLSANSLREKVGCDLDTFFGKLRQGGSAERIVWDEYLSTLAFAIRNLRMLMDSSVIISGLLSNYMIPEDYARITDRLKQIDGFPVQENALIVGQHGSLAPAIGSALFFVQDWLDDIYLTS